MKICDFTMPEIDYLAKNCNFTKEEMTVFIELSKGNTEEETSYICNMSVSTVKRKKKQIWTKIERLKAL